MVLLKPPFVYFSANLDHVPEKYFVTLIKDNTDYLNAL